MCPLFRDSTVLQGKVYLIPMCPLFRGYTVAMCIIKANMIIIYVQLLRARAYISP